MKRAAALILILLLAACSGQKGSDSAADLDDGRRAFARGFYLEAESAYERYLQKEPKGRHRREAWTRLLEISQNVRSDAERSTMLIEAMALEFGDSVEGPGSLQQLAELYEQQGLGQRAMEAYAQLMAMDGDPQRLAAYRLRWARLARGQRGYDQAHEMLEKCAEEAPGDETKARCLYENALTYTYTQSYGRSRALLEELLALPKVPEDVRPLAVFQLADIYERDQKLDKARELFSSIRDIYPNPRVVQARLQNLGKLKD